MKIIPLRIRNEKHAQSLFDEIRVSNEALSILSAKALSAAFKIEGINSWEANIIKQYLLSLGSDAAIERQALVKNKKTSLVLFGNLSQLRKLCEKLKDQPFALKNISQELAIYLDNMFKETFVFRARDKKIKIKKPMICGIVNLTPDSFSRDGLLEAQNRNYRPQDLALKRAEEMIRNGAEMIDLGGESTRPFSTPVKEKEEIKRIIPSLKAIRKEFGDILISVDTYKHKVAKAAVDEGVDIINDITALTGSRGMVSLIKKYKLGCILMHMKGKPRTMQINPQYKGGVIEEIIDFFRERLDFARKQGIADCQILIDPGIGFGKDMRDNLRIINELYRFKIFALPIFLGLSRKSFIGKILKVDVGGRLVGTISANIVAIMHGANILRVHDVKETSQAINIAYQIINN